MARKVLGLGHPNTLSIIGHLSDLHIKHGTPQLGEPPLREAVAYLKDHPGPGSYLYGNLLAHLCRNLLAQKKFADAELVARECLRIRTENGPGRWTTFSTMALVGSALLGQSKHSDAEPFLLKGYEGMKQREANISLGARLELTQALEQLVQLYDGWGKPEKAAEWRKKLTETTKPKQ